MSEELLAQKQNELTKLVIAWARENGLIRYDDQVVVRLEITDPKPVYSAELTDEDWKKILAQDWADEEVLEVVKKLYENRGNAIPKSENYRIDQYIQNRLRNMPPFLLSFTRDWSVPTYETICIKKRIREVPRKRNRR